MPKQSIYASNLHNSLPTLKVFTKEELNLLGKDFTDAVTENEVKIFVKYITDVIIEEAQLNHKSVSLPMLQKGVTIKHDQNGLLDKENPGPIPEIYWNLIFQRLDKIFPDITISIMNRRIILDWS